MQRNARTVQRTIRAIHVMLRYALLCDQQTACGDECMLYNTFQSNSIKNTIQGHSAIKLDFPPRLNGKYALMKPSGFITGHSFQYSMQRHPRGRTAQ